jgi:hypothetical protein
LTQILPNTQNKEESLYTKNKEETLCLQRCFHGTVLGLSGSRLEARNETYAEQLPMEFADSSKTRLTHVVAALSIFDQQEADKLLGDPLSCHVCIVPD